MDAILRRTRILASLAQREPQTVRMLMAAGCGTRSTLVVFMARLVGERAVMVVRITRSNTRWYVRDLSGGKLPVHVPHTRKQTRADQLQVAMINIALGLR